MRRSHLLFLAALVVAGCGLLDQLRGISFQLPSRSYSISTSDPQWKQPPAEGVPAVTCGPGGLTMDCCAPPAPAPAIDCGRHPMSCEGGLCAMKFHYEVANTVDLAKEVPALQSASGQILSEVYLKHIDLTIANSMNVALPPVQLFVAPANVKTGNNPAARKLATLPMTPPGFQGQERVDLDAAAQQAFSDFAKDFQTPFNIVLSTTVVVQSGAPAPQGKLDVTVGGKVEARF